MKLKINISFALVFVIFFIMVLGTIVCADTPKRILLIVMDGARYDYCTPETMPNLYSFMERALCLKMPTHQVPGPFRHMRPCLPVCTLSSTVLSGCPISR